MKHITDNQQQHENTPTNNTQTQITYKLQINKQTT